MIKTFKEFIGESFIDDVIRRSRNVEVRSEDSDMMFTIDGVKYIMSKEFYELGNEYNKENSYEWTCFAFNKPKEGNVIKGNDESVGAFGEDMYDLGDDKYDIYVTRECVERSIDEICNRLINRSGVKKFGQEVQDIVIKYSRELLEKHMSDLNYYNIYQYWSSDWGGDYGIHTIDITYENSIDNVLLDEDDEFYGKSGESICVNYPVFDYDWDERFVKELEEYLNKKHWKVAESYGLDHYNSPGQTEGKCFIRLY